MSDDMINTSELNLAIDGLNGSFNAMGDMEYNSRLLVHVAGLNAHIVHPAVPNHPDGVPWSDEQLTLLSDFAHWVHRWVKSGFTFTPPRIAVNAVAGSGKTTVLRAMLVIVARIKADLKTHASAFNRPISALLKAILKGLKEEGFFGASQFGDSNGVDAAGRSLVNAAITARGHTMEVVQKGDRVVRWCRMVMMEALLDEVVHRKGHPDGVDFKTMAFKEKQGIYDLLNRLLKKKAEEVESLYPFSIVNRLADNRGLRGLVIQCRNYGITARPDEDDSTVEANIKALLSRIGGDISLGENYLHLCSSLFTHRSIYAVIGMVMRRLHDTAFTTTTHHVSPSLIKGFKPSDMPFKDTEKGKEPVDNWGDLQAMWRVCPHDSRTDAGKKAKWAWQDRMLNDGFLVFHPKERATVSEEQTANRFPNGEKFRWDMQENGDCLLFFNGWGPATRNQQKSPWTGKLNAWLKSKIPAGGSAYNPSTGSWRIPRDYVSRILPTVQGGFTAKETVQPDEDTADVDMDLQAGGIVEVAMSDFTYMPYAHDLDARSDALADCLFVDEVQDLSVVKSDLLQRFMKPHCAFVMVGDIKQAIYGWAGADSAAFGSIAAAVGAVAYPMTFCWRNSHAVAATAVQMSMADAEKVRRRWPEADLPDYTLHRSPDHIPSWPMGALPVRLHPSNIVEVVQWLHENHPKTAEEKGIIIGCRMNAPLGSYAVSLVKAGIAVDTPAGDESLINEVLSLLKRPMPAKGYANGGKSLGWGLGYNTPTYDKNGKPRGGACQDGSKAHTRSSVVKAIRDAADGYWASALRMNGDSAQEAANDDTYKDRKAQCEMLEALVGLFFDHDTSASQPKGFFPAFKAYLEDVLFAGGDGSVYLSSIHRVKGGEGQVFLSVEDFITEDAEGEKTVRTAYMSPRSIESGPAAAVQEVNIRYVAMTRAKMASFLLTHEADESQDIPALLSFAFNSDEWDDGYGESSDDDDDDGGDEPASIDCPSCGVDLRTNEDGFFALHDMNCIFNDDEKNDLREAADEGIEYPFKDMVRSVEPASTEDTLTEGEDMVRSIEAGMADEAPANDQVVTIHDEDDLAPTGSHWAWPYLHEEASSSARRALAHPKNMNDRWLALDALLTFLPDCDDPAMWLPHGIETTERKAYDMRMWASRKEDPSKSQIHIHGGWVAHCLGWSMQTFKKTVEALHDHGFHSTLKQMSSDLDFENRSRPPVLRSNSRLYTFNLKDAAGGPEPLGLFTDGRWEAVVDFNRQGNIKSVLFRMKGQDTSTATALAPQQEQEQEDTPADEPAPQQEQEPHGEATLDGDILTSQVLTDLTLTPMESLLMQKLKDDWYNWCSEPFFTDVFSTDIEKHYDLPWDMKKVRGVLSSLSQKGLISIQDVDDPDYDYTRLRRGSKPKQKQLIGPCIKTYFFMATHEEMVSICEHDMGSFTAEDAVLFNELNPVHQWVDTDAILARFVGQKHLVGKGFQFQIRQCPEYSRFDSIGEQGERAWTRYTINPHWTGTQGEGPHDFKGQPYKEDNHHTQTFCGRQSFVIVGYKSERRKEMGKETVLPCAWEKTGNPDNPWETHLVVSQHIMSMMDSISMRREKGFLRGAVNEAQDTKALALHCSCCLNARERMIDGSVRFSIVKHEKGRWFRRDSPSVHLDGMDFMLKTPSLVDDPVLEHVRLLSEDWERHA